MMDPIDILYTLTLYFLRVYKWIHYNFMKLMQSRVKTVVLRKLKRIGIQVIVDDPPKKNKKDNNNIDKDEKYLQNSKQSPVVPVKNGQNDQHPPPIIMTIHDDRFFVRLASERSLGLGESYMEGWWDCERLDELTEKFVTKGMLTFGQQAWDKFAHYLEYGLFNLQTTKRAYQVANEHYDLGNSLYESFLDSSMTYTCAYWKDAKTLEEAQLAKLDLVARKLKLSPGMRVLELGCGWGALAYHLAKNYQVTVVACNIAKEGVKTAQERCKGLPVTVHCSDYREMSGKFDRVVSVGMMEHVGPFNYETMFQLAHQCLDDEGIFVVHTIGVDDVRMVRDDPWSNKYIFVNGALPRTTEVTQVASKYFTLEDWQNFGHDYSTTLMAWHQKFIQNWHTIEHHFENPNKFYRMWTYYLLVAAGSFRARKLQLWQLVLTKNGLRGRYDAPR